MTQEDQNKENLRKKINHGLNDAFDLMGGYENFGGKIIINIDRPILLEKRHVKVTFFGEKTGKA